MTTAATMAVATAAVATTRAMALTLRGNCGGRGVGEAESSKGGTVLHLQASDRGVGRGAVDELMEEDTREGEGGIILVVTDSMAEVADSRPPC
jgi:hypothetical protein